MTTTIKDPVLVVIQLSGGNDYMNTVIPYSDGLYYDFRPVLGIPAEDVLPGVNFGQGLPRALAATGS